METKRFKELFQLFNDNSLIDLSDYINATITIVLLTFFLTIVCFQSYMVSPISCFATDTPSGTNYVDYMKTYCWTIGTMIFPGNVVPNTEAGWKSPDIRRISYYQWIPFLLLFQCVLFCIPNFIWKIICHHNHGIDLSIILSKSKTLAGNSSDNTLYEQILDALVNVFFAYRDNRHDIMSELRRKIHNKCRYIIPSKRLGTKLSMSYIFVKLLFLANLIGQFFLMRSFLSIDNWHMETYYKIINLIRTGEDWAISKYFPRQSFCRVEAVQSVGTATNSYTVQCVLPINMLNEKIFIFLFFWFQVTLIMTFCSLISWLFQVGTHGGQMKEVKKYLKMRGSYKKMDKLTIERFIQQFIRSDGLFILHMIKRHSGDVIASMIAQGLYRIYCQKYRQIDLNDVKDADEIERLSLILEPDGKCSVNMFSKKPSAQADKNYML